MIAFLFYIGPFCRLWCLLSYLIDGRGASLLIRVKQDKTQKDQFNKTTRPVDLPANAISSMILTNNLLTNYKSMFSPTVASKIANI